jgi:hypothetical protein
MSTAGKTLATRQTVTVAGYKLDKLSHSNYVDWGDSARAVLKQAKTMSGKNVWNLISKRPTADSKGEISETDLIEQEDAIDILHLLITPEVWVGVRDQYTCAYDLWNALRQKYLSGTASRQALLETQIEAITLTSERSNMQAYIDAVESKVTELRSIGGELSAVTYTSHLLRGLPASYATVKVICHTKRDDVKGVKNLLLSDEVRQKQEMQLAKAQRSAPAEPPTAHALQAGRGGARSRGRGRGGSTRAYNTSYITCYECGKKGHYKADCPDLRNSLSSTTKESEKRRDTEKDAEEDKPKKFWVVSKDLGSTSTPIRWEELRNSFIRASLPACSTIPSPTLPDIKFGGLDSDFGPKPYSNLGPNISVIASSSTSPNA